MASKKKAAAKTDSPAAPTAPKKAVSPNATGWVDRVLGVVNGLDEETVADDLRGEIEWGKQLAERRQSDSRSARSLTPKDINRLHNLGHALGCGGAGKGKLMPGQKAPEAEIVIPGPEV